MIRMTLPEQKYVDAAENFDWMQGRNHYPNCSHAQREAK